MKIRKGFVSNSSSSSFVVAFPKGIEPTAENVHKYLFGENEHVIDFYDHSMNTVEAAQEIAKDMQRQQPNDAKLIEESMGGHLPGAPDYDDFRIPEAGKSSYQLDVDWVAYEKASDEHRNKLMNNMLADFGDNVDVYCFEFSDNDGSFYATLEHGGTFDAVPHMRISNH